MGPPPILTEAGWLVLYHGVNEKIEYKLGWLLLDEHNPEKILARSCEPAFSPGETYELSGLVDILPGGFERLKNMSENDLAQFIEQSGVEGSMPHVIFCCGAVLLGDELRVVYGASDSVICGATARLEDLLASPADWFGGL